MNALLPLYYQIKEELINQIESKELAVGNPIPTERAIMKTYNVSRTTARRAVATLVSEGYVYIVRGKGTFVKERTVPQGILNCASCTEMLHNMGFTPVVRLLGSEVTSPSNRVREKLQLKNKDRVFHIQRVNYVKDAPVNYTNSYISIRYCRGIEKHDFAVESLYDVLQKAYGIKIIGAVQTLEAVLPTIEIGGILGIETNQPILKFNAVVYGEKQKEKIIIETYKTYFRSDKVKFEIDHGEVL